MHNMLSPTSSDHSSSISSDALAAAAERRTRLLHPQTSAAQLAAEHEKRQTFRRLIDPGILRPNAKEQAMASLKVNLCLSSIPISLLYNIIPQTLLIISENLLREPDNPKFQQFKPTNNIIKRNLMDPKGTLEYAIEVSRTLLLCLIDLIVMQTSLDFVQRWCPILSFEIYPN